MSYAPKTLPAIGEGVHFVAQSERCCAAIITNIYSITEKNHRAPQPDFSLHVFPADKIPFNMKNKKFSNVRQELDTLHLSFDCNRTPYQ